MSLGARLLILAVAIASCTQQVQLAPDPLVDLVSIELSPQDSQLTITDLSDPPLTQAYHAIGTFSDGSRRDITAMLAWSVDNSAPGNFLVPGTFSTSNAAAGIIGVTATSDGVTATARLTVAIDATIVDATYPPPNASLFDPAYPITTGGSNAPALLYPTAGTLFPQGVARTLFQLALGGASGAPNDAALLTFDSSVLHIAVETGADRWDTGTALQSLLARSDTGSPIAVGVRAAASAAPGMVYAGPTISIEFEPDLPGGVIYFWSADTSGIVRGALGTSSAPALYPPSGCAGCHASSRDGMQLAMGYSSETSPLLASIVASTAAPLIDPGQAIAGGWSAYSPDGSMILVATAGQLALRDAQTGAPIGGGSGAIALPPGYFATHPDWSPDGASVAVAYTQIAPTDLDVQGASIAILPYSGDGTFGAPSILVPAIGSDNDYFPKFSPDGSYVAYVHASEPSQGAASAELELVPAPGGTSGAPIALAAASHAVAGASLGSAADAMPSWAPLVGGARAYLAFASTRPYGAVMAAGGRAQIWVTAIDLASAGSGGDPSSPAFWLPCQDVTVVNNDPVWAPVPIAPQ